MTRLVKKSSKKSGLPPGSLVYVGEKKTDKTHIGIFDYNKDIFEEKTIENTHECDNYKATATVSWINITGLHDISVIEQLGKIFDIHSLVLEDILHTDQRPKFEDFDNYLFIILKMLRYDDENERIIIEQVSLIVTEQYVISFQEIEGDVFHSIRERIRNGKGRIRKMGTDYLAYALIDSIVDNYFIILEKIGQRIEDLEEEVVGNPVPEVLQTIHSLKRELLFLRKSVWPLREVINNLQKNESRLIKKTTLIFLRDVYDHTIQVIDTVETYRDMVSGLLDIYMSSVSNKMNEVMKVLTIFAAIFIPLTFVAGIYGMNFDPAASPLNMPELGWYWGYPMILTIMILISLTMIIYFRRKDWL